MNIVHNIKNNYQKNQKNIILQIKIAIQMLLSQYTFFLSSIKIFEDNHCLTSHFGVLRSNLSCSKCDRRSI